MMVANSFNVQNHLCFFRKRQNHPLQLILRLSCRIRVHQNHIKDQVLYLMYPVNRKAGNMVLFPLLFLLCSYVLHRPLSKLCS